jgi:hypothetical protein
MSKKKRSRIRIGIDIVSRDRPPPSFEKKAHTEVRGSSREIRDHIHIESSGIGLQSIHIYVCVLCSL